MLKDDRMMGMLTFVVIMLALGTIVQRVDVAALLFGKAEETQGEAQAEAKDEGEAGTPALALNADTVEIEVGLTAEADVLANDTGVEGRELVLAAQPDCGRAYVRNGVIRYLATLRCVGEQVIRYRVGEGEETGELRVTVKPRPRPEPQAEAETAAAAPAEGDSRDAGPAREAGGVSGGAASDGARLATAPATGGGPEGTGAEPAAGAGPAAPSGGAVTGACVTPPTLTLDVGAGAVTEVALDAPCDAGTVAELAYDGLRFAIPLDARGNGGLAVPGLRRSTEATLTLEGGEPMGFTLPFEDIGRIDRVAITWAAPAAPALNAFEFGARPGGGGHVTPAEPRSFEAVRREGGGWLTSYKQVEGKGQRIDVYSFWRRHSGPSGVVKLALDPVGEAGAGACRSGAGEPWDYVVLRSLGGEVERARLGRIAPLDCTELAGAGRYMGHAVDDLIVRSR